MFTDTEPCRDLFFCPRKIVVLTKLMFISLFLFRFGCFALSVEAFLHQKYVFWSNNIFFLSESVLLARHEMSVVCPKHAFMPCWIAVQYVARALHFSASSFLLSR